MSLPVITDMMNVELLMLSVSVNHGAKDVTIPRFQPGTRFEEACASPNKNIYYYL